MSGRRVNTLRALNTATGMTPAELHEWLHTVPRDATLRVKVGFRGQIQEVTATTDFIPGRFEPSAEQERQS